MSEQTSIWGEIIAAAVANATVIAAGWGAAGGLASALSIVEEGTAAARFGRALRQIALGALTASGGGVALGGLIAHWLGLGAEAIIAIGAGSSVSFLTGVFGPALIEVILRRIKSGQINTGGGDA